MTTLNPVLQENLRITAQVLSEICQRNTRTQVTGGKLSRNQCYILKILDTSGVFLLSELAKILEISPAAVSKNIDRLESNGFVVRQAHPKDRRSLEVRILDEGRRIVAEINAMTTQKLAPLMDQFSEEEKVLFLGFLQRVVKYTLAEATHTDIICLQCGGRCGENCIIESSGGVCSLPGKTPSGTRPADDSDGPSVG